MHESNCECGLPNVTCVFLEVSGAFQVMCDSFFHKFRYLGGDTVIQCCSQILYPTQH